MSMSMFIIHLLDLPNCVLLIGARFEKSRDETVDCESCFDFLGFVDVDGQVCEGGEDEGCECVESFDAD